MSSVAESLYSGAATVGEIKANVTLVVFVIIVVVMSSSAIYLIISPPQRSNDAEAIVVDSECKQVSTTLENGKTSLSSECTTGVKYTIDNKEYNNKVATQETLFKRDDKINIKYDPKNPNNISYNEMSPKSVGYILCSVAIIILLIVMIYYYFINKYKPLAALEGASTTFSFAKSVFRD